MWESVCCQAMHSIFRFFDDILPQFKSFRLKLVGMFLEIVIMFAAKHFGAYLRDETISNKILWYEH